MTLEYVPNRFESQNRKEEDEEGDLEFLPRHPRVRSAMAQRAIVDGFMIVERPETGFVALQRFLRDQIIDQDEAIEAIIGAMDRSHVRLNDDNRPLASLAFLGPTGVGKSQTAKTLAAYRSIEHPLLVKIDCSDYSHGHEVAKLTGAPPGYVRSEQRPLLSKNRVEREGAVILFDEIEKGAPELYQLMLQIMGDGELQLNNGEVVSFRNTMIIMTSNLGAREMSDQLRENRIGFGLPQVTANRDTLTKSAEAAFVKHFPPEFVNRLDKMVVFHPLSEAGLNRVLDIKLDEANESYADHYGVAVSITEGARKYLIQQAEEERHNGARPLVRALENDITTPLGRFIKTGSIVPGTRMRVYHREEIPEKIRPNDNEELVFSSKVDPELRRRNRDYLAKQEELRLDQKRKEDEAKRRAEEEAAKRRGDKEPKPKE